MSHFALRFRSVRALAWCLMASLAAPAFCEVRESSLADMIAGTTVPHTIKLKELTSEWRRMTVSGEMMLGLGGVMQLSMQAMGSMLGGSRGLSDAIYTRGASLKIGDQEYLIGYRLPPQGVDFAAMMSMGGARSGAPGAAPNPPKRAPITPETELSLVLINLRAIASFSDIRPFDMAEIIKPAPPSLLEDMFKSRQKAFMKSADSNMRQLALGIVMYSQDWDDTLPPMRDPASLRKALLPYVRTEGAYVSPATGRAFQPNARLAGRRLRELGPPSGVVVLYSAVPEPDGTRIVARADGTVRIVQAEEWQKLARAQRLPDQ